MRYASQMGNRSAKNQAYAVAKTMVGYTTPIISSSTPTIQSSPMTGKTWLGPGLKVTAKSVSLPSTPQKRLKKRNR